jgi:segregation and condensation protein A
MQENLIEEKVPLAVVNGEPLATLPDDLYIPPDALRIFLETFSGPLDLLLYLIKKQNINILDIPISKITSQYMEYIELMKQVHLELAAEYLVMAAMLAEIKSRLLLPRFGTAEQDEEDPRAELIRRLQEYECYKKAAENLDNLPRLERDIFKITMDVSDIKTERPLPKIELQDLLLAFKSVLERAATRENHQIKLENLSVRDKMTRILTRLKGQKFINFHELFILEEGRLGIVVTFIAILELLRQMVIEVVQADQFAPLHLQALDACSK